MRRRRLEDYVTHKSLSPKATVPRLDFPPSLPPMRAGQNKPTGYFSPAGGMRQCPPIGNRCGKRDIIGILVDPIDYLSAVDQIMAAAKERRRFAVSALAVHGIMTGALDATHKYRLNRFDLVVPDGQPVRWALNLLHRTGLKDRVYGPKLMLVLLEQAAKEGLPVYLYGSTLQTLEMLCESVRNRFPKIEIVGAEPSKFGRITPHFASDIARRINESGAQIVFTGLGCPRQEIWAYEFRARLKMPIVAVGAAYPFIAGTLTQAPQWMQDNGLEWVFRLCREPRRLWQRYLLLNPAYLILVACQLLGVKFSPAGRRPMTELLHG